MGTLHSLWQDGLHTMPLCLPKRPAVVLLHANLHRSAVLLWAAFFLTAAIAQESSVIRLGTSRPDDNYAGTLLRRIYQEAFTRIGRRVEFQVMPAARLSLELQNGHLDGTLARPRSYVDQVPQVLRVEETVIDTEVALWSVHGQHSLERLDQLLPSGYTVNYVRGVSECANLLQQLLPVQRVHETTATFNALWMLHYQRNDLHCGLDLAVLSDAAHPDFAGRAPLRRVLTLGASMSLYPYFHIRHAALAQQLAEVLRRMKADGTIKSIRNATLEEYQLQRTIAP